MKYNEIFFAEFSDLAESDLRFSGSRIFEKTSIYSTKFNSAEALVHSYINNIFNLMIDIKHRS